MNTDKKAGIYPCHLRASVANTSSPQVHSRYEPSYSALMPTTTLCSLRIFLEDLRSQAGVERSVSTGLRFGSRRILAINLVAISNLRECGRVADRSAQEEVLTDRAAACRV